MDFFVPAAQNTAQAEQVYEAIAQFVAAPVTDDEPAGAFEQEVTVSLERLFLQGVY